MRRGASRSCRFPATGCLEGAVPYARDRRFERDPGPWRSTLRLVWFGTWAGTPAFPRKRGVFEFSDRLREQAGPGGSGGAWWRWQSGARMIARLDFLLQSRQTFRPLLQLKQRFQFGADECQVQLSPLTRQNTIHIQPVFVSGGKNLVCDQVFGRTSGERLSRRKLESTGAPDGILLVRQPAQRPIQKLDESRPKRSEKSRGIKFIKQ